MGWGGARRRNERVGWSSFPVGDVAKDWAGDLWLPLAPRGRYVNASLGKYIVGGALSVTFNSQWCCGSCFVLWIRSIGWLIAGLNLASSTSKAHWEHLRLAPLRLPRISRRAQLKASLRETGRVFCLCFKARWIWKLYNKCRANVLLGFKSHFAIMLGVNNIVGNG